MKLKKIFKKNEKGAITIMVLTAMMFLLVIITASYFGILNKSGNQDKKILQIAKQYRASNEEARQEYINTLNNATKLTMEQAKCDGMSEKITNTEVIDDYGNRIVVPAGFKIAEDSATDVTGGIVIEDIAYTNTKGSQFVWIPVGTIYVNSNKTGNKAIELGRYNFEPDGIPTVYTESEYTEDTEDFKKSTERNHGYYIGRFEARKSDSGNLTVVGTDDIYSQIDQVTAANKSRNMYNTTVPFTSDLANSYAWDTAILFEQTFYTSARFSLDSSSEESSCTFRPIIYLQDLR